MKSNSWFHSSSHIDAGLFFLLRGFEVQTACDFIHLHPALFCHLHQLSDFLRLSLAGWLGCQDGSLLSLLSLNLLLNCR